MYDFVIAGAGISAVSFAAALKDQYKICIVDIRPHIGGNCYDYKADNKGTRVHMYGPHYFHTHNMEIVKFLSKYTEWREYTHSVTGEIDFEGVLKRVPFPYSQETSKVLGRDLSQDEVIEKFFKGYSEKMWGISWDDLPPTVKNRVPKDTKEKSIYFPNQFSALPTKGYTHMMENMIDGCDVILSANFDTWKEIPAKRYIYCGRPDLLLGTSNEKFLEWRNIKFEHKMEDWDAPTQVVNFCHKDTKYTRKTNQGMINQTDSRIVTYEVPVSCDFNDPVPFYPVNTERNKKLLDNLKSMIKFQYPNLELLGRLGTYRYIDMDASVAYGIKLASKYKNSDKEMME